MDMIKDIRHLPEISEDMIHIWGVYVPDIRDQLDRLHELLCDEEQAKAARFFRVPDRQASIAARGALRVLLSGYTGMDAADIVFSYTESGKPHLDCGTGSQPVQGRQGCPPREIAFNVSHSGDWVVLALGRNRNIGVDIEQIRREVDVMAIAARYFTAVERGWIQDSDDPHTAFFQLWARKEAYIKACGSTLFQEVSSFEVPLGDGEKDGWFFHKLEAGSRHAAAVVSNRSAGQLPCYDFSGLRW